MKPEDLANRLLAISMAKGAFTPGDRKACTWALDEIERLTAELAEARADAKRLKIMRKEALSRESSEIQINALQEQVDTRQTFVDALAAEVERLKPHITWWRMQRDMLLERLRRVAPNEALAFSEDIDRMLKEPSHG